MNLKRVKMNIDIQELKRMIEEMKLDHPSFLAQEALNDLLRGIKSREDKYDNGESAQYAEYPTTDR
jgi:hypothetical protein